MQLNPTPDTLTPEQIIDLRRDATDGKVAPHVADLADIALGWRFAAEERRAARIHLALLYASTRGPLADLLVEVQQLAVENQFDDDQDPALDNRAQRITRAFRRFEALS